MCVLLLLVLSALNEDYPQVATKVVEMSSDAATKLWEDSINQRLFDLVHSPHSHDKLGGILAIGMPLLYDRIYKV